MSRRETPESLSRFFVDTMVRLSAARIPPVPLRLVHEFDLALRAGVYACYVGLSSVALSCRGSFDGPFPGVHMPRGCARLFFMLGCLALWSVTPAAAQSSAGKPQPSAATTTGATSTWAPPRTPWGEPDLTGLWPANDMQGTPYERPAELGTRSALTDAELTDRQKTRQRQAELDAEQYIVQRPRSNTGTGPPSHWGERGNPSRQTSLIVDPPDGRLPPMTAEGKKRIDAARSTYWYDFPDAVVRHPFETFTDLGPYDRCITRGTLASMLPTGYNMGTQIFQYPGHVVIQNEMIHEVRDIPTDGRPHISSAIRQWMGDSRGRWEGDTLVIETTNFNAKVGLTRNGNTLLTSQDLRLVERLTRVGPDTMQYEATVSDPKTWTRPYTVSLPFRQQTDYQMFEYACHEGNYAMRHILSGERAAEKAAEANH
jgi:hypothetical protein